MVEQVAASVKRIRVRIFVDFWNFSLSLKAEDGSFQSDWKQIGSLFTQQAGAVIDPTQLYSYEGLHVYGSFAPGGKDQKFVNWFNQFLGKQPGIYTSLVSRQNKKSHPKCPSCQSYTKNCWNCSTDMRGTEEKGVDTRIVTDMISLAWANSYDAAVIVSSDRDFVPVAQFLQSKGIKVIHAAFPPRGSDLTNSCWGSFKIPPLMGSFAKGTALPIT